MTDTDRPGFGQRLAQLRLAFTTTRQNDPRVVPLLLAAVGLPLLLGLLLGFLLDHPVIGTVVGLLLGVAAGLIVFGQRTSSTAIGMIEGRPGAAAAVLQSMRGPWRLTPGVAFTRKQDFVHLLVGRPGIVLVGEGAPARVSSLLKQEKRRIARVAGETPVHEVSVGDGTGQVPLRQLQLHVSRLPNALKKDEIRALDTRLGALGASEPPMPKGPLPRTRRR